MLPRAGGAHILPAAVAAPSAEPEAQLPLAELPAAPPPPSATAALPVKPPPAATRPSHPAGELDLGRTPKLLTGAKPQLPMIVRQLYRYESVVGSYRICVQPSGVVASVTALSGIPFDDEIQRVLQTWRFVPRATPACLEQELHFEVDQ